MTSRKAIDVLKRLETTIDSEADLLLHFVECGVKITNLYGAIDEKFYTCLEDTYSYVLELIHMNRLLDKI